MVNLFYWVSKPNIKISKRGVALNEERHLEEVATVAEGAKSRQTGQIRSGVSVALHDGDAPQVPMHDGPASLEVTMAAAQVKSDEAWAQRHDFVKPHLNGY